MPRNMSFNHTIEQCRNKTKTVTRRLCWNFLKRGDLLWQVEKGQGLKKGEKVKRIHLIRVLSNISYPLVFIDECDIAREGFPRMNIPNFWAMFCKMNKCKVTDYVNRIEFEYVD